jgi:hypothetical protein
MQRVHKYAAWEGREYCGSGWLQRICAVTCQKREISNMHAVIQRECEATKNVQIASGSIKN